MNRVVYLIFLLFSSSAVFAQFKSSSVFNQGSWHKLSIEKDGIYKLDYSFIKGLGIAPEAIDIQTLGLFSTMPGMLNQKNADLNVDDLEELPLYFELGNDNKFNRGDYILFYGHGPDKIEYDINEKTLKKTKHLYDRANYYFLTIDSGNGKRISAREGLGSSLNTIWYYDDFIFHEVNKFNLLKSGREWIGEQVESGDEIKFEYNMEGIASGLSAKVNLDFISTSTLAGKLNVNLNDSRIGEGLTKPIPKTIYGNKGSVLSALFSTPSENLVFSSVLNLGLQYANTNESFGYLEKFTIQIPRTIKLYGNQTQFQSLASLNNQITTYLISDVQSGQLIWDITNPLRPINQDYEVISGNSARFSLSADDLHKFITFVDSDFPNPENLGQIENQNLHGIPASDVIIITPESLKTEAERLADFRRTENGLTARVASLDQIYNEFSGGRKDISGIRNFIRSLYLKGKLKYTVLFGDASYNYFSDESLDVPTYQSRESLHSLHSYASDDYYGFMDSEEGNWFESSSINNIDHDLDIAIGRLPVKNIREAKAVVDKLIHYETSQSTFGSWRNRIVYIADDGESNKFQLQSVVLSERLETGVPNFNTNKIFVDAYPQDFDSRPVTKEINEQIQNGVLMVDFIGHGGETAWTNEGILKSSDIVKWNNKDKLPLFLIATCEFGRYDDPQRTSGAELALLQPHGGAIGLFSTSRPAFLNTNFDLSSSFYESMEEVLNSNQPPRLGDISRLTKNKTLDELANRNFSLLGDPCTTLAFPKYEAIFTEISGLSSEDGLLNPLERVRFEGAIMNNNQKVSSFNGIAEVILYDKPTTLKTLGDEGEETVMDYINRENIIFKGNISVTNGEFKGEFTLPSDLDTLPGLAKWSIYAQHETEMIDASGYDTATFIGGQPIPQLTDTKAPKMAAFLNSTSFNSGDLIDENPVLIVELKDENGINLSDNNNRGIKAIIDFEKEINLTPFYTALTDRFDAGEVIFTIFGLQAGPHHISISSFDNFNNKSQIEFDFQIAGEVAITDLKVFPNPSSDCATFIISHKNNPDNSKLNLTLYDHRGTTVRSLNNPVTTTINNRDYISQFEICKYTQNKPISSGLYYYKLSISPGKAGESSLSGRLAFIE